MPDSKPNLQSKDDDIAALESTLKSIVSDDEEDPDEKIVTDMDDKPSKKEGKEGKEEKEEKEEEEDENLEKELSDEKLPKEEELEQIVQIRRQDVLKKYPNVFKDFPDLERAYYREQQFTEVFPTIAEAKDAAGRLRDFQTLEQGLLSGRVNGVLESLQNTDKEAFLSVAENFLPTLAKLDEGAYNKILGNFFRHTVNLMNREGEQNQNDNLKAAAYILNQYIFGTTKIEPPMTPQRREPSVESEKLERERITFNKQRFEVAHEDIATRSINLLTDVVSRHLDPKEQMSSYVKSKAISDVLSRVDKEVASDTRFVASFNRLWEQAFENGFTESSKNKIKQAWLAKARNVLPQLLREVRSEALKGQVRRSDDEDKGSGKPVAAGKPAGQSKVTKASQIPKNMKTLDFLNQD